MFLLHLTRRYQDARRNCINKAVVILLLEDEEAHTALAIQDSLPKENHQSGLETL